MDMIKPRGVILEFYVAQRLPSDHQKEFKRGILQESGMTKYFEVDDVGFETEGQGTLIKIICSRPKVAIGKDEEQVFYKEVKKRFSKWVIQNLYQNGYQAELKEFSLAGDDSRKLIDVDRMDERLDEYFELAKDVEVDMDLVKEKAEKDPQNMAFQNVKGPEEYKARLSAAYYFTNKEYEKAKEHASHGIDMNSKSAYLFYIRGYCRKELGNLKKALQDMSKALEIEPEYAYAFYRRAEIKKKLGDEKGAHEDFKKAYDIRPSLGSE